MGYRAHGCGLEAVYHHALEIEISSRTIPLEREHELEKSEQERIFRGVIRNLFSPRMRGAPRGSSPRATLDSTIFRRPRVLSQLIQAREPLIFHDTDAF